MPSRNPSWWQPHCPSLQLALPSDDMLICEIPGRALFGCVPMEQYFWDENSVLDFPLINVRCCALYPDRNDAQHL